MHARRNAAGAWTFLNHCTEPVEADATSAAYRRRGDPG